MIKKNAEKKAQILTSDYNISEISSKYKANIPPSWCIPSMAVRRQRIHHRPRAYVLKNKSTLPLNLANNFEFYFKSKTRRI